jgi:phytoene synthase
VPANHFTACESLVREVDYDRYLATLFAPADARPYLFALYAFNHEIARTAESVSQPVMGQIRLQWWREAVGEIYAGRFRDHEVVRALSQTVHARAIPQALLETMIDARENDLDEAPFSDWASLEAYADATSGHVMRLAARILGAGEPGLDPGLSDAAREAGIAYALAGLLRALPFHAARRRLMLPAEALRAVSLSQEQILSGIVNANVTALIAVVAGRAREHLGIAHQTLVPRAFLPALLPASIVPLYLKMLTRPSFNPFRHPTDIPVHRRQLAMLRAMLRRRL